MAITSGKLKLYWDSRWVAGEVTFGSDNRLSLIVEILEDVMIDGCIGDIVLLGDEQGAYTNLMTGRPIPVEWQD